MNAQSAKIEGSLASAMAAAFAAIEGATKGAQGQVGQQKYKYADITAVIDAVKPALIANGLFFTQHCHPSEDGVTVETVVGHCGGESLSLGSLYVPANKKDAQAFGSALTYARRYALVTAFGVPVEDDDGNAAARGQSQGGAVSPSQFVAGDAEKPKPAKLAGPYTSKTALQTAVKGFVHEMNGCGDADELSAYLHSKDSLALLEQVKRDFPQWWDGGPDMPEEFVPLHRQIEMKEYEMAQQIADLARA
jgi:hypothetical protein